MEIFNDFFIYSGVIVPLLTVLDFIKVCTNDFVKVPMEKNNYCDIKIFK